MAVGTQVSKYEVALNGDSFRPGDSVSGTLTAAEDIDARSVTVALRYYQQSPDYLEYAQEAGVPVVHQGALRRGETISFSFQVPQGALPSHVSGHGQIGWRVVAQADLPRRPDHTERWKIEVEPDRAQGAATPAQLATSQSIGRAWVLLPLIGAVILAIGVASGTPTGMAIGGIALAAGIFLMVRGMARNRAAKNWDVSASCESTSLHRGGDLQVSVRIGAPASQRQLEAGVACKESYAVRTRDSDGDHRRQRRSDTAHEQWIPLDPSATGQTVAIPVPEGAPFSFTGNAVSYSWSLTVRERRGGADPSHTTALQILP